MRRQVAFALRRRRPLIPPPPALVIPLAPRLRLSINVNFCYCVLSFILLMQLAMKEIVPIAYCKHPNIRKVENFVPAYLLRFTRNIWQLLDEKEIPLSQHNWDDGDNSIIKLFGTFMQHPEDDFVKYFGGTQVTALKEGQPLLKEGSPHRSARKNTNQGIQAHSPTKTPHCGCAAGTQCKAPPSANLADSPHLCWGCKKKIHSSLFCGESILNLLSKNPSYISLLVRANIEAL